MAIGKEVMSNLTIVNPSKCLVCAHNDIPHEKRTVILLPEEERCGYCGNTIGPRFGDQSTLIKYNSSMLDGIAEALLRPDIFAIDPAPAEENILKLYRADPSLSGPVTCTLRYETSSNRSDQLRPVMRYERYKIAFAIPECVRAACELLAGMYTQHLDKSVCFISFDGADVRCEGKTLRFSWIRRVDFDNGYEYNYATVVIEISWPEREDTGAFPSPDEVYDFDMQYVAAGQEMRVKADITALRAVVSSELKSASMPKVIPIGGMRDLQDPRKTYSYHRAAVQQIVKELRNRGWRVEQTEVSFITGMDFLVIERRFNMAGIH